MHSINTDTRQIKTVPGMGGRGDILPVILKLKQNKTSLGHLRPSYICKLSLHQKFQRSSITPGSMILVRVGWGGCG